MAGETAVAESAGDTAIIRGAARSSLTPVVKLTTPDWTSAPVASNICGSKTSYRVRGRSRVPARAVKVFPSGERSIRPGMAPKRMAWAVATFVIALLEVKVRAGFSGTGPINDVCTDAREWKRCRTRLGDGDSRQGREQDLAGLGLPPGIHDRCPGTADVLVVPQPGLGVDRLANGPEDTE